MTETVSLQQRRRTLDEALRSLTQKGWVITSQTETTAQLAKSGQKSGCLLLILLIFGILPGILYAVWPASQQTLFVIVDEQGRTRFSGSRGTQSEIDSVLSQEMLFTKSLRQKKTRLMFLRHRYAQTIRKRDHAEERSDSIVRWTRIWLGLLSAIVSLAYLGHLARVYLDLLEHAYLAHPGLIPSAAHWIPVVGPWLITLFVFLKKWNPMLWYQNSSLGSLEKEISALERQIAALRISVKRGF